MILLRLFFEFARTGLFAVGGGLATIPFLQDIAQRTGWFTQADLTTMIALSESTPGPIGVNMATFVGYETAGVPGAVVATLGLITPSLIVIVLVARVLQKFRQSKAVEAVFYGLRPASTALVAAAGLGVAGAVLLTAGEFSAIRWPTLLLAAAVFACLKFTPLKKFHPIVFIGFSALMGVLFQL